MFAELKFGFLRAALWATCHGHQELGPLVPGPAWPQHPGALSSWGLRTCAVIVVSAYLSLPHVSLARRTGSVRGKSSPVGFAVPVHGHCSRAFGRDGVDSLCEVFGASQHPSLGAAWAALWKALLLASLSQHPAAVSRRASGPREHPPEAGVGPGGRLHVSILPGENCRFLQRCQSKEKLER